jgi:molecular chaperone DnaJ
MTPKDYYEILGLDRNATDEEIKGAFRKLAFKFHPDHNHEDGAETKFKEINGAYEVLSDPEKRAAYDRYGQAGTQGIFGQGFEGFGFGGFGDIFDAFFGATATATRQAPQRGADLSYEIAITLEEAAFGCDKEIKIARVENCSLCQGIGCKQGSQPSRCPQCNGTGEVRRVQQSIFGRFTNITTCSRCRGEGRIITEPCPRCHGSGREKHQRSIVVNIPQGVDTGTQIRLAGEGDAGSRGGSPGNLYTVINVRPHPLFKREGDDILYEQPINVAQAALGARVSVPTLHGEAEIEVPSGCQSGRVFRLKNKGVPHLNKNGRGDQIVRVTVVTPEKLTEEQRRLFQQLANTLEAPNKIKKEP